MKNIFVLCLLLIFCFAVTRSYSQFHFKLLAIENGQNREDPLDFGEACNIRVSYLLNTGQTNEQALNNFQNYYLIINGIPYPQKKIKDMQVLRYVKRKDSDSFEVVYQTRMADALEDKDGKKVLSTFWTQQYQSFYKQRLLPASLLSVNQGDQEVNSVLIKLRFYEWWRVVIFIVVFIALLWLTLDKAAKYKFSLLRDDPNECKDPDHSRFSLSRVQVFFWTFVIFGLFSYLWAVTDFLPTITAAHLVLLGIAAGQRILAQIIDANTPPKKLTFVGTDSETKCSVGFFTDLISDDTGLSITRLQYLITTIIFLIVFIIHAIQQLELIDFSVEQLALMGTSAGLYLWNKKLDQQAKLKTNP